MSCQRCVLVPRCVNLTGKRDNAGHEKTTVNKLVSIHGSLCIVYIFCYGPVVLSNKERVICHILVSKY